jgi:hypothetical protein
MVGSIESAQQERSVRVRQAERLADKAEAFASLIAEHAGQLRDLEASQTRLAAARQTSGAHRDEAQEVIRRLSARFDQIVRELAPGGMSVEVRLGARDLQAIVHLGGQRTSTAIESLKVVAFDLAVLTLAIEGAVRLPALLLHDSPREADLTMSIYHRLFAFVRGLEELTVEPLFQYIVTTTTEPPNDLRDEPWLRLTLRGAPATERLLTVDL